MFGLEPVWAWATITALLLIIEVTTGTFFLYLVAGSSALTALFSLLPFMADIERQLLLFAVSSLVTVFLGAKWLKRENKPVSTLNNPGAEFIGQSFSLTTPIIQGRGSLTIYDAPWQIRGRDMPKDSTVRVMRTENGVLYVEEILT